MVDDQGDILETIMKLKRYMTREEEKTRQVSIRALWLQATETDSD